MLFGCADAVKGYTAAPQATARNSRRLMGHYFKLRPGVTFILARRADVRFGSKADICGATTHVRFTPNSDRESRHAQMVMSALHPIADMCSAARDVRFGPKADIAPTR